MLTDAEKTDIRRFCGYPAYGAGDAGNMGWRFYTAYGALEYRMNNLAPAEEAVARRYLGTLTTLESAVPGAGATLDTDSASGWRRNADEVNERLRLLDTWRRRLCAFFGVPPGEGLGAEGVRFVV
ncbi:MAG TPA: hypothetical protein VMI52_05695 [Acetobacteraceae bacterium]|nr:hypothetical protein [Acetobacteraceae bacterium]